MIQPEENPADTAIRIGCVFVSQSVTSPARHTSAWEGSRLAFQSHTLDPPLMSVREAGRRRDRAGIQEPRRGEWSQGAADPTSPSAPDAQARAAPVTATASTPVSSSQSVAIPAPVGSAAASQPVEGRPAWLTKLFGARVEGARLMSAHIELEMTALAGRLEFALIQLMEDHMRLEGAASAELFRRLTGESTPVTAAASPPTPVPVRAVSRGSVPVRRRLMSLRPYLMPGGSADAAPTLVSRLLQLGRPRPALMRSPAPGRPRPSPLRSPVSEESRHAPVQPQPSSCEAPPPSPERSNPSLVASMLLPERSSPSLMASTPSPEGSSPSLMASTPSPEGSSPSMMVSTPSPERTGLSMMASTPSPERSGSSMMPSTPSPERSCPSPVRSPMGSPVQERSRLSPTGSPAPRGSCPAPMRSPPALGRSSPLLGSLRPLLGGYPRPCPMGPRPCPVGPRPCPESPRPRPVGPIPMAPPPGGCGWSAVHWAHLQNLHHMSTLLWLSTQTFLKTLLVSVHAECLKSLLCS